MAVTLLNSFRLVCIYFRDEVLCTLFTFFGLLSSSLLPCLSQPFGRCTLLPSLGGWNVKHNPLFCLPGWTVLVMDVSYLLLISPLKVLHCLHWVLISHTFRNVTGSKQHLYQLWHVFLRTSVYEFLGIINLMSSATIFTSAHIANLLLSLHALSSIPVEGRGELSEGKLTGNNW